jgi:hypothetical protein
LLQDNFSAHIPPDDLTNILVENFKPNLTAHVQPCDAGIIHCFESHYHTKFAARAVDRYDHNITPAQIYDIDQLQAMHLADLAWNEVDTTTIRNCWCKSGILPDEISHSNAIPTPSVPIAYLLASPSTVSVEDQLTQSLNDLENYGVLSGNN